MAASLAIMVMATAAAWAAFGLRRTHLRGRSAEKKAVKGVSPSEVERQTAEQLEVAGGGSLRRAANPR